MSFIEWIFGEYSRYCFDLIKRQIIRDVYFDWTTCKSSINNLQVHSLSKLMTKFEAQNK